MIIWQGQTIWYNGLVDDFAVALWGSSTFPRVLAELLQEPGSEFTFADLVARSDANRESIHRALRRALVAGLVTRRRVGNQFVYQANAESPIRAEMTALLAKTHGVRGQLIDLLGAAGPPQVEAAFLFGSAARGSIRADSDIDIFVVGSATRVDIARLLGGIQESTGRQINALAYPREEVERRLDEGDAFFLEVWAQPKVMLVGSEGDLAVVRAQPGRQR